MDKILKGKKKGTRYLLLFLACGKGKKPFSQPQKGMEDGKGEHYYLTLYSSWH